MTVRAPRALAERQGRALVELVRRPGARVEDPVVLLRGLPLAALADLACHHRLPGLVHRSLGALGIEDPALDVLRAAYQMAAMAHARCLVDLAATADALAELTQPWLVVKGPVLVETGYGDPGARLYEDLDLVVAPSDLSVALALLEDSGGHVPDLSWKVMARLQRAEIPMVLAGGMLCDLHWHLLVTPNARARFDLSMAELVERRRPVALGTTTVATLDPVDGILYLCLHGSLSGGHQLVWLKDIDQMIDSQPPDWNELIRRARRARLGLVAAIQLARSRAVLGADVPLPVVDALAQRAGWWRLWQRQEEREGMARWGGYDRTGRTFVAATSGGTLDSAVQFGRSLVADVAAPMVARRADPGATDDAPPLYRLDDQTDGPILSRVDYLEGVAGGTWERPAKRSGSPSYRSRQWSEQK
jgi:hypothetical protein